MPSVAHVVVTNNFAGVERYVCHVANETARRGWTVYVVGGDRRHMRALLAPEIDWLPGGSLGRALVSTLRLGRVSICHVHMTAAEAAGVIARSITRSPVLATRHFAARRGASRGGAALAPLIRSSLAAQIAVSRFVAAHADGRVDAVLPPGLPASPRLWVETSRVVLVMQRLEPEKNSELALRAWRLSNLPAEGWRMRIVGSGSEQARLVALLSKESIRSVKFAAWTSDVAGELANAGMLLATAPADSFGLSVLEAMWAGVPAVASAAGGHLETVGLVPGAALFPARDADAAAATLRRLADDRLRAQLSAAGREIARSRFSIERHVDGLLAQYDRVRSRTSPGGDGGVWRDDAQTRGCRPNPNLAAAGKGSHRWRPGG